MVNSPMIMNHIDATAHTLTMTNNQKKKEIIPLIIKLKKAKQTYTWWYQNILPIIMNDLEITKQEILVKRFAKSVMKPQHNSGSVKN